MFFNQREYISLDEIKARVGLLRLHAPCLLLSLIMAFKEFTTVPKQVHRPSGAVHTPMYGIHACMYTKQIVSYK